MRQRDWAGKHYRNPYFRTSPAKPSMRMRMDVLLLVVTLFVWIYVVFFSPLLTVQQVHVQGVEHIPISQVQAAAFAHMQQPRWGLFPQNNIMLFDRKAFAATLHRSWALDRVHIRKQWPTTVVISLQEKITSIVWLQQDHAWMVDTQGIALQELMPEDLLRIRDAHQVPIVTNLASQATITPQMRLLDPHVLHTLLMIIQQVPLRLGQGVTHTTLRSLFPPEVEITVEEGWNTN
jgi:hypothetical protein